jgi:hypothetical protein
VSSVQLYETTKQRADRKQSHYGFILVLLCMALGLVVASAIFKPAPVGTGINDKVWWVGP